MFSSVPTDSFSRMMIPGVWAVFSQASSLCPHECAILDSNGAILLLDFFFTPTLEMRMNNLFNMRNSNIRDQRRINSRLKRHPRSRKRPRQARLQPLLCIDSDSLCAGYGKCICLVKHRTAHVMLCFL